MHVIIIIIIIIIIIFSHGLLYVFLTLVYVGGVSMESKWHYLFYCHYCLRLWGVFPLVLADKFSQEFEWEQVS